MFSPRNSVRVVPLIARGWRETSLPRVNIRKEIQRHRCWAFLRKHGYSEEIHGGLRLESVIPTALKHSYHGVIDSNIRMNKCWITLRKRNTYGVERNQLQNKMGGNTAWYVGKHNAIFIILRSKLHQMARWNDANGGILSNPCSPRFASSRNNGLWVSNKGG